MNTDDVPSWGRGHDADLYYHFRLLSDPHRLAAYERALRRLVRPGDVVLDLGAGTGVLSLLAARRGARKVYALESQAIAGLAEELVRDHGLGDVVEVVQRDALTLPPPREPVDLIVSDFMGVYVVDDGMLWAVEAAARWLKPGGRFCPAAVTMRLAPVDLPGFAPLELWEGPLAGLDLRAGRKYALNADYRGALCPDHLLAPAQDHAVLRPPAPVVDRYDRALRFTFTRAGRLRALAGWFTATLAEGVVLDTGPETTTHWQQYLFPLPHCNVAAGDTLEVRLVHGLDEAETPRDWTWRGVVHRNNAPPVPFALETNQQLGSRPFDPAPPAPATDPATQERRLAEGTAAFVAGDYPAAAAAFEALTAALGPADDALAPDMWENLGLAYAFADRPQDALYPLLRALDGDLTSREQSARFLVSAYFQLGWKHDAERALAAYEAAFGPHPAGWRAGHGHAAGD